MGQRPQQSEEEKKKLGELRDHLAFLGFRGGARMGCGQGVHDIIISDS